MGRRCGTPQNFFLALIDELKKQLLKKLLKWANKKCKNFNTMLYFFKKKQRKTPGKIWRYYYFTLVYQTS